MSETWGPRGHPERCDEDMRCSEDAFEDAEALRRWRQAHPNKSLEESLGTGLGILMLALILAGAVLWWVS